MNSNLQAALSYYERGWSVIPLQPGDKRPLGFLLPRICKWHRGMTPPAAEDEGFGSWENYQFYRARPDALRHYWEKAPRANLGVVTGRISGFIALDEDSPEGSETIAAMGGLPPTLTVLTSVHESGFRKRHHFFQHPGFQVRNFAKKIGETKLPGLDGRGDGGFVMAVPSIHPSGTAYEWVDPDAEIAEMPAWLYQLFERRYLDELAQTHNPAPAPIPTGNESGDERIRKFVIKALEGEVRKIQETLQGELHVRRLASAKAIGGLLWTNVITFEEAAEALFVNVGPNKDRARKAIRDGLLYGMAAPREIKEPSMPASPPRRRGRPPGKLQMVGNTALAPEPEPDRDDAPIDPSEYAAETTVENGETAAPPALRSIRGAREKGPATLLRGRAARAHVTGNTDESGEPVDDLEEQRSSTEGMYAISNGRTVLVGRKASGEETGSRVLVADFAAFIDGEVRDENGFAVYTVKAITRRGKHFTVELQASKMSDPKYVAAQFLNGAGAGTIIYAGMEKHLAPSIHQFSDYTRLDVTRRFTRVGWTKDMKEFIVPGMEAPDMLINLSKELAYKVKTPDPGATELRPEVAEAFHALLRCHRPELTTVAVAHALIAPFAPLAHWRDDKFALFVSGRTGSFKTSVTAQVMCLYGDFSNEDRLLKFGMGGTSNAMMSFTADASDMPLLIDNFKPGTGGGQNDAQSLIHAILEGGEKKRLNRDGSRKEGKAIHCWPIITGEDTLDDTASVARMLIVTARWDSPDNAELTRVQSMSHLLPEIGGAWLSWLLTEDAKIVAEMAAKQFFPSRSKWANFLRENCKNMVNTNRVASSLALCEGIWEAAQGCPALAPILRQYTKPFKKALEEIARGMGSYTAQTHEANRYLGALQALLMTNRAYLTGVNQDFNSEDRRTFLGWEDDNTIYLQPDAAFAEVSKFLRDSHGLNGLTKNTIHKQLDQLNHLARKGEDQYTQPKRVGGQGNFRLVRLLWIKRTSVFEGEEASGVLPMGDEE